ncbi:GAF domain-containing protein [Psychroflexus sp. ALD_RP9]|uniref:GAF domain-containing protein n=1 Tax=Psychroflexus sp. ALD_RP9 TaxID=2777186 RepID=UPI001A8EA558|nr:GAF domain-containing protein [Psychroflexus sp. ALD_RP9]QSS97117.1 GAF domain-containing protein [Psychroflexus sp. ALD_RP9]
MKQNYDYPFTISVSFEKVVALYEERLKTEQNSISKAYIKSILEYAENNPKLTEGLTTEAEIENHKDSIKIMLDDIFPNMLSSNEIKAASIPFKTFIFNQSERFAEILEDAGPDFKFEPRDFNHEYDYLYACVIILNNYYGYKIDFFRPIYYDIPNKNGVVKTYRLFINADFVEIEPTELAIDLSDEIVDLLISKPDDIELWKTFFPKNSWKFKGFTLLNLTDITVDEQISKLKSILINKNLGTDKLIPEQLTSVFRNIFKIQDLEFGFTLYNHDQKAFEILKSKDIHSYILGDIVTSDCNSSVCQGTLKTLVNDNEYFCISDVETYAKNTNNNQLSKNLLKHQFHSCILAPVAKNGHLIGVLEIVAKQKNQLNQINAIKLNDVLPYIYAAAERNQIEAQNRMKAVIQSKYTSIHKSVEWRFEEEASKFIDAENKNKAHHFKPIVFEDIYPLYGQIDIVASSEERNKAIVLDLSEQLKVLRNIFNKAIKLKPLSIYEHSIFRIKQFLSLLEVNFTADLEQNIKRLIQRELNPVLSHISDELPQLKSNLDDYQSALKQDQILNYSHRDAYDDIVQKTNEKLADQLDQLQEEAQVIYPHYFERYKTDGVEHNLYIGQSITKHKKFNLVLLQNLRLWQLEALCKLENTFYDLQQYAEIKLNAASLILAFNSTLSIRYRMDEKKFDVDGTYNARYEVIKKRIDKALIKDTQERITQKGKIAIIYTDDVIKHEYKKYIGYLQNKQILGDKVEEFELEKVQGVSGLKAIRVDVMYKFNQEKRITYKDLIEILHH